MHKTLVLSTSFFNTEVRCFLSMCETSDVFPEEITRRIYQSSEKFSKKPVYNIKQHNELFCKAGSE